MSAARAGLLAALLALAAGAACNLRAARLTEPPCNTDKQCAAGQVCFANECRSPASALASVMVEVVPPTNSTYAPMQAQLDLKSSAVAELDLAAPERLMGTVVQDADADAGIASSYVAGATIALQDALPLIPGRPFSATIETDPSGAFSAHVPAAQYAATITPPAPLPPASAALPPGDNQKLQLHLPPASALARVTGTLRIAGQPLAGARLTPVAQDGSAEGATVSSGSDGRFTLVLPPAPVEYFLRVGDAADGGVSAASGPMPSFADDAFGLRSAAQASTTGDVDLPTLPAPATLSGSVVDGTGAPLAGVRVIATSLDQTSWTLTRTTVSDGAGHFALALREGRYAVEAAPSTDSGQPALSGELELSVTSTAAPITLMCPARLRATGKVLTSDGKPIAGATVTATRQPDKLIGSRPALASPTDTSGAFTIVGDPGSYRVEVVPAPGSGQPRQAALVQLSPGATALDPIQMAPPLTAVGTVRGPPAAGGALQPVSGATVSIYAITSDAAGAALLGTDVSDANGRYSIVLPDVSQPGLQRISSR